MLVAAIGYQQAAAKTGIKYATLRQWAKRFHWNTVIPHAQKQMVTTVTTPGDALRQTLNERSNKTKLGLSLAAEKAAEHLAGSDPVMILAQSDRMHNVAKTSSLVHGWEAGGKDTGPFSPQSIQILSQRTYLNMGKGNEENE